MEGEESNRTVKDGVIVDESADDMDDARNTKSMRECPVPKPGGLVGEILGFKGPSSSDGKGSRPP
jgi:cytochrome c oxidase assembly factor 2